MSSTYVRNSVFGHTVVGMTSGQWHKDIAFWCGANPSDSRFRLAMMETAMPVSSVDGIVTSAMAAYAVSKTLSKMLSDTFGRDYLTGKTKHHKA